jgi:hypothetical protein
LLAGFWAARLTFICPLHLTLAGKVADYRSCPTNGCTHSTGFNIYIPDFVYAGCFIWPEPVLTTNQ